MSIITMKSDSLNILMDKNKINVNTILKDLWNGNDNQLKMQLTTFYEYYYKMCKETKINKLVCCYIVFGMCKLPIPQLDFNLDSDNTTIEKTYNKFKKDNIYSHTFTTRKELISIILFHFITHGYILKQCIICGNFFITKDNKNTCCSEECKKKRHSLNTIKYKNNNPLQSEKANIRDMLKARLDIDDDYLDSAIKKCDRIIKSKKYTDDEKLDKLKTYHADLYRNNSGGGK